MMASMPSGLRASWMAPRPKRMFGIVESTSCRPSRRNDGNGSGKWKPAVKIVGLMRRHEPGDDRAAGPADPEQHDGGQPDQPGLGGRVDAWLTLPLYVASITPPTPASRPTSANRLSFDADHRDARRRGRRLGGADGGDGPAGRRALQVVDARTRPRADEDQQEARPCVRSSARSNGPSSGRSIVQPRWSVAQPVPLEQDHVAQEGQGQRGQRERQAAEAQRGQRDDDAEHHRRRPRRPTSAGEARPVVAVEQQRPRTSAATVTKAAWARLTMPPRPVTITNDMKIEAEGQAAGR